MTSKKLGSLKSGVSHIAVTSIFAVAGVAIATPVDAGPENGNIRAGDGTITTNGSVTRIKQNTDRLIVEWESFDIEADEAVRFNQPDRSSIALNRVTNDIPTQISGELQANGNVWIINRQGVTFNKGSRVDVGGLLATTADIDNNAFMAGQNRFDKPGAPGAQVINEGHITVGEVGLAALISPDVANHGVIEGKLSTVVVGGAETFAVDLAGDGLIAFEIGDDVLSAENGPLVSQTGEINADGGRILLTAAAANDLVNAAIDAGGESNVGGSGRIDIDAGAGRVDVTGTLNAVGGGEETGGAITITGDAVRVAAGASIDASGATGGGQILVGGAFQGGDGLRPAKRTLVERGATLSASATGVSGDGGEVIVWADETTGFFGELHATGGSDFGGGGFAEVSGKVNLAFDGFVDLSAADGSTGDLLLDPTNIVIQTVGADDASLPTISFADGVPANPNYTISASAINGSGADITLQATNDITVDEVISASINLDFQAGNDIVLNQNVTTTGNITLTADAAGYTDGAGTINFAGGSLSGDAITISTGEAVVLGAITAGSLTVTAGGNVTQNAAATVTGATGVTTTPTSLVTLDNAANDFGSVGATGTSITINDVNAVALDAITADALTVTAGGNVTQNAAATVTGATGVTTTPTSLVTLDNAANDFGSVGATGTTVTINDTDAVALDAITADALTVTAGGNVTQNAAATVTGATDVTTTPASLVTLDNAANDFGSVGATGTTVTINDTDAVALDAITADALTVTAGGNVTQNAAATVTGATGVTTTPTSLVTLDNAANDFGSVGATGTTVTINDTDAVALDAITADALTVTAGGNVTQNAAATVTGATGVTTTPTSLVTLDNAANDFGSVGATGTTVTINDTDAVALDAITADALTVTAGGNVTQNAAATVTGATGVTTTPTSLVTLDNAANDFGSVGATGTSITINDVNAVALDAITADALTVTAGGNVTQNAAATVTGATDVTTTPASLVTLDQGNDFGSVGATGTSITINDVNAVALDAITADALTVTAGGNVTQNAPIIVTGNTTVAATDGAGTPTLYAITLDNALNDFGQTNGYLRFLGSTVTANDTNSLYAFDSFAETAGVLTAVGDLTLNEISLGAAGSTFVGISTAGAIDADNLSTGLFTLGGTGSVAGDNAANATGAITINNFAVDGLYAASAASAALEDGDAGATLRIAAPVQSFNFVTVDAFTNGAVTNFNTVVGSTANTLTLERMYFDEALTVQAGAVNVGHLTTLGALNMTATTDNIQKIADASIDFTGAATNGFTVLGGYDAADQMVTLQAFPDLLNIGGDATLTADADDIILTRGVNPADSSEKQAHFQGRLILDATDAFIEDRDELVLGSIAIDNDFSLRINADNTDGATETLTQDTAATVGGTFSIITGVNAAAGERSNVVLTDGGNAFGAVEVIAGDVELSETSGVSFTNLDLSGDLVVGTAGSVQAGDLVLSDALIAGDLAFNVGGAATLSRVHVDGNGTSLGTFSVNGVAADDITVRDINALNGPTSLSSTAGSIDIQRFLLGATTFSAATSLTAGSGELMLQPVPLSPVVNLSNIQVTGALTVETSNTITVNGVTATGAISLDSGASADVSVGSLFTPDMLSISARSIDIVDDAIASIPATDLNDVASLEVGATIPVALGVDSEPDGQDDVFRVFQSTAGADNGTLSGFTFTHQLDIGGMADLDADQSIILPREAEAEGGLDNDFGLGVSITNRSGGAVAGDVFLSDANSLELKDVMVGGDLSIRIDADNTNGAAEALTQTADGVEVAGRLSVISGLDEAADGAIDQTAFANVTLDQTTNAFNTVRVIAGDVSFADADGFTVDHSFTNGSLTIGTSAAEQAGSIVIEDVQATGGLGFDVAGGATLTRVRVGDVDDVSADTGATIVGVAGGAITATDLAARDGRTTLTAETGAIAITDAALDGFTLNAATDLTLTNLDDEGTETSDGTAGGDISVQNARLGRAGEAATLTANGNVTVDGVTTGGALSLFADADTNGSGDVLFGSVDVGGMLTASGVNVAILDAATDPVDGFTVDGPLGDRVGKEIPDPSPNALDFRIFQDLGDIADVAVAGNDFDFQVRVGGMTDLDADQSIILPREAEAEGGLDNDFGLGVSITNRSGGAVAGDVFLSDANSLELKDVMVGGDLSIRIDADNTNGAAEALTQTADGVEVAGRLSVISGLDEAADGAIDQTAFANVTLDQTTNAFNTVRVIAGDVSFADADGFTVDHSFTNGSLTIGTSAAEQAGSIVIEDVQATGGLGFDVAGGATLTRVRVGDVDDVSADTGATIVGVAGGAITATDLAARDGRTTLTAETGAIAITDAALDGFTLNAATDLTLTNLDDEGTETSDGTAGGDISVQNARLGRAGEAATLTANGNVTVDGVTTGGALSLFADADTNGSGDVLFGSVDVGGMLTASGVNVAILDAATDPVDGFTVDGPLGDRVGKEIPDPSPNALDFRIFQDLGDIADVAVAGNDFDFQVRVGGMTDLDADQSIILPREAEAEGGLDNDFGLGVSITNRSGGAVAGDVFLSDANSLELKDVMVGGDLSIRIDADNTNGAAEALTQTADGVEVAGRLSVISGLDEAADGAIDQTAFANVTLDQTTNAFNTVRVIAGDVSFADADGFTVDHSFTNGSLTIGTSAAEQAGSIVIEDVQATGGLGFDVAGGATLTRVRVGDVDDVSADTGATIVGVAGGAITATDLAARDGRTTLTAETGAIAITDAALDGFTLNAATDLTLTNLDDEGTETSDGTAGGDISVQNARLGRAGEAATLTANGNVTVDGVTTGGALSLFADADTNGSGDVLFGSVDVGGMLTASGVNVAILDAATDPVDGFTVDGPLGDRVGKEIPDPSPNALDFRIFQDLGDIADVAVAGNDFDFQVRVGGMTDLDADQSIILPREAEAEGGLDNDFGLGVSITNRSGGAVAGDVFLSDANSLELKDVMVGGDLSIRIDADNTNGAAEALTQTADGVEVAGRLSVISGLDEAADGAIDQTAFANVTLDQTTNAFNTVRVIAGDVSFADADGFTVDHSFTNGSLTIGTSAAEQAGSIVIEDVQATGGLGFDVAGGATLTRVRVGDVDDVSADTGATIVGVAGGAITATDLAARDGRTTLTAETGAIAITDAALDGFTLNAATDLTLTNLDDEGTETSDGTAGGDISVQNARLGRAGEAATLTANGNVTVDGVTTGGALSLFADADTNGSGDVLFGSVDVGGMLTASGVNVAILDAATDPVDGFTVDGPLGDRVGKEIPDPSPNALDFRIFQDLGDIADVAVAGNDFDFQVRVGGMTDLDADQSIILPREAEAEGGLDNDFGLGVSITNRSGGAVAGDVVLEDQNDLAFNVVSISGDLAVRTNTDNAGSDGEITQSGAMTVGGDASFITGDRAGAAIADTPILADVTLDNAVNDFGGSVSIIAENVTLRDATALNITNSRVNTRLDAANTAGAIVVSDVAVGENATISAVEALDLTRVAVGGALTGASATADISALDLGVTGQTALTANAGSVTLQEARLVEATTVTAGVSASLTDVSTAKLTVDSGTVTIERLAADSFDLDATGETSLTQARLGSVEASSLSVTDADVTLRLLKVENNLTVSTGTGAIGLADVDVDGDAEFTGGSVLSADGAGEETRLGVDGDLNVTAANDVELNELQVDGASTLTATAGSLTLDDFAVSQLTATAGGAMMLSDGEAAREDDGATATMLTAGSALAISNLRAELLNETQAGGSITLTAVRVSGDAEVQSLGGNVTLNAVRVDGEATIMASGSIETATGADGLTQGEVAGPMAVELPEFVIDGPAEAEIGVEVVLPNSPAEETRVVETVAAQEAETVSENDMDDSRDNVPLTPEAITSRFSVGEKAVLTGGGDIILSDVLIENGDLAVVSEANVDLVGVQLANGDLAVVSEADIDLEGLEIDGSAAVFAVNDVDLAGVQLEDAEIGERQAAVRLAATIQGSDPDEAEQAAPDDSSMNISISNANGFGLRARSGLVSMRASQDISIDGEMTAQNGDQDVDLNIKAGSSIRFGSIFGNENEGRFGTVTLSGDNADDRPTDVDIGLAADRETNLIDSLVENGMPEDIFFVNTLVLGNDLGAVELARNRNLVDDAFFGGANFGLNLLGQGAETLTFAGGQGSGGAGAPTSIDLLGSAGGVRGEAATLSLDPGRQDNAFRFNNCTINDAADCGLIIDAPFTPITEIPTPDIFELNIEDLADVYASGGNEEFWPAPPAFSADLEDEEEEEQQ